MFDCVLSSKNRFNWHDGLKRAPDEMNNNYKKKFELNISEHVFVRWDGNAADSGLCRRIRGGEMVAHIVDTLCACEYFGSLAAAAMRRGCGGGGGDNARAILIHWPRAERSARRRRLSRTETRARTPRTEESTLSSSSSLPVSACHSFYFIRYLMSPRHYPDYILKAKHPGCVSNRNRQTRAHVSSLFHMYIFVLMPRGNVAARQRSSPKILIRGDKWIFALEYIRKLWKAITI